MSCLSPITIVNPSKYVSLHYKDRYLLQVPCGHCAECQKRVSQEWQYRTLYEFADVINAGGFVYFTTLSYDNKHLPRVCDVLPYSNSSYPCFSKVDLTTFLKRLRSRCDRELGLSFRYFLSTEYGHDKLYVHCGKLRQGTNRPHYHLLFFVYFSKKIKGNQIKSNDIFLTFSRYVGECWQKGLTDDLPFRSPLYVLQHNVIATNTIANVLRTASYVTKYVQKSCEFTEHINKRVADIMRELSNKFAPDDPGKWLESIDAAKIRRQLNRIVCQFHLQSLHYGESALSEMDICALFDDGYLVMPSSKCVKMKIALPTYYKRKLFYRLVEIDGVKSWQLNEDGVKYRKVREKAVVQRLESQLQCICIQHHLDYDCRSLARYIMYDRGRIKASVPSESIEQKLQQLSLFNYVTETDKVELSFRGLSPVFLGNSTIGYSTEMVPYIRISEFIQKYVILDPVKEKAINIIYYYIHYVDKGKQEAFKLEQHLRNLFKCVV